MAPATQARADGFRDDQWYLQSLSVSQAQKLSNGAGITVAVIDSGSYPHPDIRRNILAGINFTAEPGDGRIDQIGHGTNMASIIAAHGKNGSDGVLGIAPSSKILPIRISNSKNSAPADKMARGITWAAEHGAKVINISAETGPSFDLADAVNRAIDEDIVIVSGAGNTGAQAIVAYPGAIKNVLTVGAVGRNGQHAPISVASSKVDICAPGVQITSAQPKNKYVDVTGTSAATAVASGAAALVRARFPNLTQSDVIHRLTATADDTGPPGRDNECGFGRLNLVKALTADVPPLEGGAPESRATAPPTTATAAPGGTASAVGSARAAGDDSGSGRGLVYGGIAAVVALGGGLLFALLRRRRGGGL
ncbi:S8 family serine peptidase [Actinoplanes sp. CA-054009]